MSIQFDIKSRSASAKPYPKRYGFVLSAETVAQMKYLQGRYDATQAEIVRVAIAYLHAAALVESQPPEA